MSHIFISYAHEDFDLAESVMNRLRFEGFTVWMDEHLKVGEDWRQEIDKAIKQCSALLVILSPDALQSTYVNYEWSFAIGADKPVIPVLYREPDLAGLHVSLAKLQHINFSDRTREWDKLLLTLRRALHKLETLLDDNEAGENTKQQTTTAVDLNEVTRRMPLFKRSPYTFCLEVILPDETSSTCTLDKPHVILGRSDGADIVIKNDAVSRKHLHFILSDRTYAVEDLGSSNGTLLNGEPLKVLKLLESGDELILANVVRLRFEVSY